ncbi:MAG: choice-of-anchor Q domain-containing protein [Geminicoccaceae bacterium]
MLRKGKGELASATGDLNVTRSVDIKGAGPSNTIIDGGVCDDPEDPNCTSENVLSNTDRVLSIVNDGANPTVRIEGLTIQNGGGLNVQGGGVRIYKGAYVTIVRSRIRENKSRQFGGGIMNSGNLQVIDSAILRNTLPIHTLGGQTSSGGGILNDASGKLEVVRSLIAENEAVRGAGIRNGGGAIKIVNSTISGNKATASGGGLWNLGSATIAFTTIAFNEANRQAAVMGSEVRVGGGIYNLVSQTSDTITNIAMGNSILAKNTDNRGKFDDQFAPDCHSTTDFAFDSFRGNVVGVLNSNCIFKDTIFGNTQFDQVGSATSPLDPQLVALAANGGLSRTHALLSTSPAVDKGTGTTSATFFDCRGEDQRLYGRPVDGNGSGTKECDAGAFERGASPPS